MQRSWLAGFALCVVMVAQAVGEETLIIAPRVATPATGRAPADSMTTQIRLLGGDQAQQATRYEALRVVARLMDRAGSQLVDRLDAVRFGDWTVRRGALRGIQALGVTGPRVSSAMAWAASRDPELKVRNEAVSIIRARGDRTATKLITQHLVDAFDPKGIVRKADVHDNAVHALRAIGDRRTAEALATYVFLEVQAGFATNMGMDTQRIRSVAPIAGGGAGSVDLPIEMPRISVMKFRGTVVVPALAALRSLTGQDFGRDREQWTRWIRSHPPADWR